MSEGLGFAAFIQATAGAVGGIFATWVLMPLEVVKTRVQISQHGDAKLPKVMADILAAEGLVGLFRGVSSKCSETGSKNFVFFFLYDFVNREAKKHTRVTPMVSLALGYIAGLGTTITTMPLEVLSTKQQAITGKGAGFFNVLREILAKEGIAGLFKGFWFNVLLCINPAIQNTCFDKIKELLLWRKSSSDLSLLVTRDLTKRISMSASEAFVLGAVAKAIATIVTFPLTRLKTMLQAGKEVTAPKDTGDHAPTRSKSASQLLKRMSYRSDLESGLQGCFHRFCELYRGLGPSMLKGVLQAAVLYGTKDQVARFVSVLLKSAARLLSGGREHPHKFRALSGRPLAS